MKLLSKKFLMPAFAAVVGLSFAANESAAADMNAKFSGRVTGYYWSGTAKANDDADSISNTKFVHEGRFGVVASATEGEWKGSAKLELDTDSLQGASGYNRDHFVMLANKQFYVVVGRKYAGELNYAGYVTEISDFLLTSNNVSRTQLVAVGLKGIPNISANIGYVDVDNGASDVTGFRPAVGYKADNFQVDAVYESITSQENDDRGGDDDNSTAVSSFGIGAKVSFGNIDVFGNYENRTTTVETAADDVDTGDTEMVLGANVGLGNNMGITAGFKNDTTTMDDVDDTVTTAMTVAFRKTLAGVQIFGEYVSSSTTADDSSGVDGAKSNDLAAGMRYWF
ncbi:MAG: hypothetical protein HQM14_13515 [SAR324 cluster bacterium]|nr:hypothetical protein [SAR324 cluster bacterium]